jgi:hypothetical protein
MSQPVNKKFGISFVSSAIAGWRTGQKSVTDSYTAFPDRKANQIAFLNSTGKELAIRRSGTADDPFLIPSGSSLTIPVADNLNEIEVKNNTDAVGVTLPYYSTL